mgnify:CR=1 FL=1
MVCRRRAARGERRDRAELAALELVGRLVLRRAHEAARGRLARGGRGRREEGHERAQDVEDAHRDLGLGVGRAVVDDEGRLGLQQLVGREEQRLQLAQPALQPQQHARLVLVERQVAQRGARLLLGGRSGRSAISTLRWYQEV